MQFSTMSGCSSERRKIGMELTVICTRAFQTLVVMLMVSRVIDAKPSSVLCGTNEYLSHSSSSLSAVEDASSLSKDSVRGRQAALVGMQCLPCSTCPKNQIVRRPCLRLSDTICGPLYDFEFFNHPHQQLVQLSTSSQYHRTPAPDAGDGNGRHRLLRLRGVRPHSPPGEHQTSGVHSSEATDGVGLATPTKDPSLMLQCFSDEWSVVCYGFLLGVPIVLITVVGASFFVSYRLRVFCFALAKPNLLNRNDVVFPQHRPLLVFHQHGSTAQVRETSASAAAVDRRVRHLETQLRRQRQQRDSQQQQQQLARLGEYGGPSGVRRIAAKVGNDYVDLRSWFRTIRSSGGIGMSTLAISDRGTVETASLDGIRSTTTAYQIGEIV